MQTKLLPKSRLLKFALSIVSALLVAACRPLPAPPAATEPTAAATLAPSPTLPAAPTSLLAKVDAGELEGVAENGIITFKGVPYVAAPVGDLRWRRPQPAPAWDGVRKTDAFGKACPQNVSANLDNGGDPGPMSEDCLYLNVWTPNVDAAAKLPVLVWIHGGAFVIGAANLSVYNGTSFARRGAVVVSFNYRLGALGFFKHPALDKETPNGPANFGLLDQIEALKWVQRNIAAFGGDPSNVTIFGESAGGQSVLALFASPLARGLFQRGVVESCYGLPDATLERAQKVSIDVANAAGLSGADATMADLRALTPESLVKAGAEGHTLSPVPITGDEVLPMSILDTFEQGKQFAGPLIIGNNSDEASVALAFGLDPALVVEGAGAARIALKALYPGVNDNSQLGREVVRDLVFGAAVRRLATRHARIAPVWRYYFTYVIDADRGVAFGVPHGGEIPFVFDSLTDTTSLKDKVTAADLAVGKLVNEYWYEFAHTGTPRAASGPQWLNYDQRNDNTMVFGETVEVQKNLMKGRLDIFATIYPRLIAGVLARTAK